MIEEPDRCPFCGSHVPVVSDDPDHRWMGCACGFASAFRSKRQMLASERIADALERIAARLDNGVPVENVTGGYR